MGQIRIRRQLKVVPVRGELKRFFVESQRTGQPPYLVDCDSYDCHGECKCKDFDIRMRGKVEAQMQKPRHLREFFWCAHLFWAHMYLHMELLRKLKEAEPQGRQPAHNREN